jgi:putative salt-induced outer membrane protein YdiY
MAISSADLFAQDRITLTNGDVLHGTVKAMAEGKLTITSTSLGDVVVPGDQIENLTTGAPIVILTSQGERLRRRIAGIEDGLIRFAPGEDGAPEAPSMAFSNLDQLNPPPRKPAEWTGSFKLGSGWFSGNTERRNIGAAIDAERRTEIDRISADASWDYAEDRQSGSDWNLTQRRAGGGLKYDYFLDDRWYALATTRVLGDTLADINLRYTAGLGMGNQLIDDQRTSLLVEVGVSYFNENYRSTAPSVDYLAARVAYKLRRKLTEDTRLIHGVEAFPSLEDKHDVYFQAVTEMQTNLTESMIGSISWTWDYDNTPSPGRDRSDHRVLMSVGWTF